MPKRRIDCLAPPPTLKPYILLRWCCHLHGYFETRTDAASETQRCPECGEWAWLVDSCRGMTADSLPSVSRPRKFLDPEPAKWQVTNAKGITGRARQNPKSIRSGKSTGRPRKKPRLKPLPLPKHCTKDEAARVKRAAWLEEISAKLHVVFMAALINLDAMEDVSQGSWNEGAL